MAATAAAALLDELMGRDRNLAPTEQRREVRWEDPETCKYFLCAFCPHELFVNTRADLGPCDKIHDEELRKNYQKSSRFERMGYEEDFLRFLQSLLADVERRIKRGHARLALNNSQAGQNMNTAAANREEQVEILTKRINDLVEEAEQLGCEGKVEEAQGVMRLCEQLKEERGALEGTDKRDKQQADGDGIKKMDVCDVCGALLVAGDAQQRIDEHLMGKQHMGYARIRSYVDNRKKKLWGEESDREERINKEREEREKEREREKEERRKKLEEREKEREKEREEREREREKEREREQRRRRSRSRSRSRRSRSKSSTRSRRRSRSRDRRKRSRSRDRSRDRSRRHRSRSSSRSRSRRSSRSRGRRSRSRSRRRSRDRRDRSRSKDRRDKEDHKSRETDDQGSKGKDEHGSRDKDDYKSRSKDEHRSRERDDHKSRDKRDRSRDRDRDRDRKSRERDSYRSRDRDEKRSRDKDDHRSRDKESGRSRDQEDRRSREREDRRSGERDDYRSRDRDDKSDRGSRDEDTRRSEERDMRRDSHGSPDNDVDHRSRYREDEEDRIRDHKGSPDDDNWAGGKNEDISYKRSTNQEYSSSAGHGKWDSDEEDERMDMGNGGEDGYRMSGDRADDRLGGAAAPPSFADEVMDTQGDSN